VIYLFCLTATQSFHLELPKQRPRTDSYVKATADENTDKVQPNGKLRKGKDYVGSHPNLSKLKEMHKDRSATLPPSFRQGKNIERKTTLRTAM
jgi:hypothetical protein